jgi:hypothetical protein
MSMWYEFEKPYQDDTENMISGLEFHESADTVGEREARIITQKKSTANWICNRRLIESVGSRAADGRSAPEFS